jgi:hypothetical protein
VDELSSILERHRESIEHLDMSLQILGDYFEAERLKAGPDAGDE